MQVSLQGLPIVPQENSVGGTITDMNQKGSLCGQTQIRWGKHRLWSRWGIRTTTMRAVHYLVRWCVSQPVTL